MRNRRIISPLSVPINGNYIVGKNDSGYSLIETKPVEMIDTVNASLFRNSANTSINFNAPTIPYIIKGTYWGGIAISTVDGNYVMTFNTTTGVSFNKRFAMSNMIKNDVDYYDFSVAGTRGTSITDFKIIYSTEDNPTKQTNMVQVSGTLSGSDFIVKFVPATGINIKLISLLLN